MVDERAHGGRAVTGSPGDEELMARFGCCGDPAAFEALVVRHTASAYRTARAILGVHHDAEDAVQECFLRVMRARRSFRADMRFSVWFYTILRNICRDGARRRGRAASALVIPPARAESLDASDEVVRGDEGLAAREAFAALPDAHREVLALRIYDGLSFADVAAICGLSTEAAKKRAQRGIDLVRRSLAARERRCAAGVPVAGGTSASVVRHAESHDEACASAVLDA